jgi:hypothetical protein
MQSASSSKQPHSAEGFPLAEGFAMLDKQAMMKSGVAPPHGASPSPPTPFSRFATTSTAQQSGVCSTLLQPGGSVHDDAVIRPATNTMVMAMSGIGCFTIDAVSAIR